MKTVIHKQTKVSLAIKEDGASIDINTFSTPSIFKLEDLEVSACSNVPGDWAPLEYTYSNGTWEKMVADKIAKVRMINPTGAALVIH